MRLNWKLLLAWQVVISLLYVLVSGLHTGSFFTLLSFIPVFFILMAVGAMDKKFRLPWLLIALGQLFFALGDAIAYNYEQIFDEALPFPSMSDIFYQLTYPCMLAGVALLIYLTTTPEGRSDRPWHSLILTILGVLLAIGSFLLAPFILRSSADTEWLGVSYPIWDFCLLVGLIHLTVQWKDDNRAAPIILMVAVTSLMVVDVIYAVGTIIDPDFRGAGTVLDIGWLTYYALLGASAVAFGDAYPKLKE